MLIQYFMRVYFKKPSLSHYCLTRLYKTDKNFIGVNEASQHFFFVLFILCAILMLMDKQCYTECVRYFKCKISLRFLLRYMETVSWVA